MFRLGFVIVFLGLLASCGSSGSLQADTTYLQTDLGQSMTPNHDLVPTSVTLDPSPQKKQGDLHLSLSKKEAWNKLADYFVSEKIAVLASDRDLGVYFIHGSAIEFDGKPLGQGLLQIKLAEDSPKHVSISFLDVADRPFDTQNKTALLTLFDELLVA